MSDPKKETFETLSAADAAAVDALLARDGSSPAADPVRRARADAWLKVVGKDAEPVAPGDLLARTLAAVENAPIPMTPPQAPAVETYAPPGRWRRRLAEFGAMAVAASLLIMVTLQAMSQSQHARARVACGSNLMNVAKGFSDYGGYWYGELPVLALPASRNWIHASEKLAARNNNANLIPLVNNNFAPVTAFYCPGNSLKAPPPGAALINELPPISYSYRNLYGNAPVKWDGRADTIILADQNPLFPENATKVAGDEEANSRNHKGQGNYVLRADGSVTWETKPNIGPDNDNIWTVGLGKQRPVNYTGTELPASEADVFLAP